MTIDKRFAWRGAPVRLALASRYADLWHYSAIERQVTCDSAAAAKSATQLKRMAESFASVLDASQLLAMKAAAEVSSRLAADLRLLRPWAMAYSKFCAEKQRREREEHLDALAAQLWMSEEDVLAEAADLIAFYDESAEGTEVEAFISKLRRCKSAYRGTSGMEARDALSLLPGLLSARKAQEVRRCAARVLDQMTPGWADGNSIWYAGRDDYLAWRKAHVQAQAAAAAAAAPVGAAGF